MKDVILTQEQTSGQGGDIQGDSRGRAFQGEKSTDAHRSEPVTFKNQQGGHVA